MNHHERKLGLDRAISRRDFLNGVALGAAGTAGATLGWPGAAYSDSAQVYPPALTGLRGDHPGSFETAHALAWHDSSWPTASSADGAGHDLVVVGAGLSGLAAAFFYRQRHPGARVLILDNHDDFGGHAKRNEFTAGGRALIGYGGSQSLESPANYSAVAKRLLKDLGIDTQRFYTAYDMEFWDESGLSFQTFFDREHYGVDRRVPISFQGLLEARAPPSPELLARLPLSEMARTQLARLYVDDSDPFAGLPAAERLNAWRSISIAAFLRDCRGCGDEAVELLTKLSLPYWGVAIDALSASDGAEMNFLGCGGFVAASPLEAEEEPYIFHFPDGNASIARLLVRRMIPSVAPGSTMEDIVTARFDYANLDDANGPLRIRLNSTAVQVRNVDGGVEVVYVRGGRAERVRASACVIAAYNRMVPHLVPELPGAQKEALEYGSRAPLVYTNVLIRNWRALEKLGIAGVYCPGGFFHSMMLDFPVSLGGYEFPRAPDEPALLHLVHVPHAPHRGLSARQQFEIGQRELLTLKFVDFERHARQQLGALLGPAGFDPAEDILAITVNRWPHGYAYEYIPLWDPEWPAGRAPHEIGRKPIGRIHIAGSDAGARAYLDEAVNQAYRAVAELASKPA